MNKKELIAETPHAIAGNRKIETDSRKVDSKRQIFIICAVLFVLSFLVYLPTLKHSFVWDDHEAVSTSLSGIEGYSMYKGRGDFFRPFIALLYGLESVFWQGNPVGYHLTNILLNSFAGVLAFGVSLAILGNVPGALVAALLFILHPAHADSVAWVSGRTDIIAAIFFFLSFLSYLTFRRDRRYAGLALSCLFMLFCFFSKEVAVALPLIVFSYDRLIRGEKGKDLFYPQIFFALTIVVYALFRGGLNVGMRGAESSAAVSDAVEASRTFFQKIVETLYSFGFYFKKLLAPFEITLFPDVHLVVNLFFGLLFIILLVAALTRRLKLLSFVLLLLVFALAPTFLTMLLKSIPVTVAVRYLYLPVFGLSLIAGYVFTRLPLKAAIPAVAIVALIYAAGLHSRNMLWENDVTVFEYDAKKNQDSAMAHLQYVLSLVWMKQNDKAEKEIDYMMQNIDKLKYRKELHKQIMCQLAIQKGRLKFNEGDLDGAEVSLNQALNFLPNARGVNFLLGQIMTKRYLKSNNRSFLVEARRLYENEWRGDPGQLDPNYALGFTNMLLGQTDKAEGYFARVVALAPESKLAGMAAQMMNEMRSGAEGKKRE